MALEPACVPRAGERAIRSDLERQVVRLLVEAHAPGRGIQARVSQVARRRVGLGTISALIQQAQRRAQAGLSRHAPPSSRPLGLDAMEGNDRRGADRHGVDPASHAVWAAAGPVPVDTERWTLVRSLAQARGLRWHPTSRAGGAAIDAAVRVVDPAGQPRRAVWPVLHGGAQVPGRLDRWVAQVAAPTARVQRQAAARRLGSPPVGAPWDGPHGPS
jgi:hypothetical protein